MIQQAIIISLITLYIWYTYQKGQVFEFIGNWLRDHLPKKLHHPAFSCPACQNFWYGSAIYWIFFHVSITNYILTILSSGGISVLFVFFITVKDALLNYKKLTDDKVD